MDDADLDAMAELLGDPVVIAYYPAPKTRQQALDWITWNKNNYAEYNYGLWIIETADGDFVGDCGLTWQDAAGHRSLRGRLPRTSSVAGSRSRHRGRGCVARIHAARSWRHT